MLTIPTKLARILTKCPQSALLSQLYDEDGEEHSWSLYMWSPRQGAKNEKNEKGAKSENEPKILKREEIGDLLRTALVENKPSPLSGYSSQDWVCSICGVHWSETDKLNEEKVEKQLRGADPNERHSSPTTRRASPKSGTA